MSADLFVALAELTDDELLARVKRIVKLENETTASLVAYLAEMDRRDLYLAEGCSSLFSYCTQVLHLSEHAAYGRIGAARAARKFPVLLQLLARGSVNLTTVLLLAPLLTPENHLRLLESARHTSKRQVEELVARIRPQPPVPSSVRKLPTTRQTPLPPRGSALHGGESATQGGARSETAPTPETAGSGAPPSTVLAPAAVAAAARRATVVPLAPEQYKVQFTANTQMHQKLRRVQDLLRHQIPNGDLAAVLDRALTVLLHHLEREKIGVTERPRASRGGAPGSRHIPAGVRRVVWVRDGRQCGFVSDGGRRCTETGFLEFHHVEPHGDTGKGTVENIEIRCRAHNRYEAEMYFGPHQAQGPPQQDDQDQELPQPDDETLGQDQESSRQGGEAPAVDPEEYAVVAPGDLDTSGAEIHQSRVRETREIYGPGRSGARESARTGRVNSVWTGFKRGPKIRGEVTSGRPLIAARPMFRRFGGTSLGIRNWRR